MSQNFEFEKYKTTPEMIMEKNTTIWCSDYRIGIR